jgi:hypothetical protein
MTHPHVAADNGDNSLDMWSNCECEEYDLLVYIV